MYTAVRRLHSQAKTVVCFIPMVALFLRTVNESELRILDFVCDALHFFLVYAVQACRRQPMIYFLL